MVRTQIQLTETQAAQLRAIAHARNTSIAAVIRQALDEFLHQANPNRGDLYRKALESVGGYEAKESNISTEHDRFLEEDFLA